MIQRDPSNTIFSLAADFINYTSRSVFLTGKAGTGKTTFLKYIRESTIKNCVVAAPTGVAAINAGGVTLHSLFQLPFGVFLPGYHAQNGAVQVTTRQTLFQNLRISQDKKELLREIELLIIDEVSMVRCDMMDAIDAVLRHVRRSPLPFGGVQVLYIGDLFQLPPVALPEEWELLKEHYESPFFFHSHAVKESPPLCIGLEKIYRQNDKVFIDLLNSVRNNQVTEADLALLNSRHVPGVSALKDHITLTSHNYKADSINKQELGKLPGKLYQFKALIEGDFSERSHPAEMNLSLKEGAKVMFIRNDSDEERRYFNGKLATVTNIDNDKITVSFGDNSTYELKHETWENIRYHYDTDNGKVEEEPLGSFTQFPVRLAWAITIHKSQGLTFEKAIIDAGDSFTAGQVYVALSRCTSLDGLTLLSRITRQQISTHAHVLYHDQSLETSESLSQSIGPEKERQQHKNLIEVFDLSKVNYLIREWAETVPQRKLPDSEAAQKISQQVSLRINELVEISKKFQQKLEEQLTLARVSGDYTIVYERIEKAVGYYNKFLKEEIFNKLKDHVQSLKGKSKVKKYLEEVKNIGNAVALKSKRIRQVQLNDRSFYAEKENEEEDTITTPIFVKKEKGNSAWESLALFRKGYDTQRIATMRNFALSTIEGHLAKYITTGEVAIERIVEREKIAAISKAILEAEVKSLSPIKEKLGNNYSYSEIRAVMNHLEWEKTNAQKDQSV